MNDLPKLDQLFSIQRDFGSSVDLTVQAAVLLVGLVVGWLLHRRASRWVDARLGAAPTARLKELGYKGALRMVFPLTLLVFSMTGRSIIRELERPSGLLDIAGPAILALAAIRLLVYLLRMALGQPRGLRTWEYIIGTSIWIALAFHLIGWLDPVLKGMEALGLSVGAVRISLLAVVEFLLVSAVLVLLSLWLARVVEGQLARNRRFDIGMRLGLSKVIRVALVTIAVLVAFNSAGIDLTALTVFGGALGVGLGFGLQRIASNLVSGFLLLFDRSIRPGDVISIGDSFGWVQEMRGRYVVVRNREGVDTLIPNENLITSEVINWSYGDKHVRIKVPVQISYSDDPELALELLQQASTASSRVVADPPSAARLIAFGDSGINLELRVWIDDPENGLANVRTDINLAIWRLFREHGITIPFPQRDVHLRNGAGGFRSSEPGEA